MVGLHCFWSTISSSLAQDDSEEELPSVKRAQARKKQRHQAIFGSDSPDRVEAFLDLSCEEGEETASSEVAPSFSNIFSEKLRAKAYFFFIFFFASYCQDVLFKY